MSKLNIGKAIYSKAQQYSSPQYTKLQPSLTKLHISAHYEFDKEECLGCEKRVEKACEECILPSKCEVSALECGHLVHEHCRTKVKKINGICPRCNEELMAKE